MGCSSSKIFGITNHNKTGNIKDKFPKEKKVEAILISKKIKKGNEIQQRIINFSEKNNQNLLIINKENLDDKAIKRTDSHHLSKNLNSNQENALVKINNKNKADIIDVSGKSYKNFANNCSNDLNKKSDSSVKNESNKNNVNKSNKTANQNIISNLNDNLALIFSNNSKGSHSKENNFNKIKTVKEEQEESRKIKSTNNLNNLAEEETEKCENKNSLDNTNKKIYFNNNADESAISKLPRNLMQSKVQNLKDTNIAKDENDLILNLTKMQNLTHFQDNNQTKNFLNSIEKDDNLIIKFNTGEVANSLLNNTNFKINESQTQQNISNINNNPSIGEENKSGRFSFKFDLTSNFDLHSKFSKIDSTNNISRIKVPYYDYHINNNNNYEQNYTLTNASHMNDLNNLTNLNNNINNNNNNNNTKYNNNVNFKNFNNPPAPKNDPNKHKLPNTVQIDSNDNMEEEEIKLSITLSVRASKFEAMYPIWIEKNKEVEFKVIGKWTIDSTFPACDCNGYVIKNKKEAYTSNTNNNISNITSSTNFYTASTNNTNLNIHINNKNMNSNNLILLNSPTANKAKTMQDATDKNSNLVENVKKSLNTNSDLVAIADQVNNANANVNIENSNNIKNEINSGFVSQSTAIQQEINSNNNKNMQSEKQLDSNNTNKIYDNNNNSQNNKSTNSLNCLLENYPNGCLIGRVLGGPYFHIKSKCTFISEYSGPLFLKMNVHDLRMNPEGKLSVFINGAEDLPFMSIEKKLGWDINNLSLGCQLQKTESERLIYTFINKIRINSNLFAQQYLENIKTLSNTTNSLYVSLFENKKTFKLLNMDAKLLEYGRKLLKREIERLYNLSSNNNNINNNINSSNNSNINSSNNPCAKNRQEILENENKQILQFEKNLNLSGYKNMKYFIKKHEDTKPLSVTIKLIIDDKVRQEILSMDNNSVGLFTIKLPQLQKGFFTCLIFGNLKSEQNLITETNKNESEIMMTD
jgi:hypothetical protein